MTFEQVLQYTRNNSTSILDGMRIEASRALISGTTGDMLRMGTNVMIQHQTSKNDVSKLFLTSDFSISNPQAFNKASKIMFKFLMAPSKDIYSPFFRCMTIDDAVKIANKAGFIGNPSKRLQTKPSDEGIHVTTGLLNFQQRMLYTEALKNDRILGPLLHLIAMALKKAKHNEEIYDL
jgi:hypothetical protein